MANSGIIVLPSVEFPEDHWVWPLQFPFGITPNQKGWQSINYDSLKIKNYVRTLFGRNYVTSALAGIFFYDFIQQIPLLNFPYSRHLSRTDRLNNEECDAVQRGLRPLLQSDYPSC